MKKQRSTKTWLTLIIIFLALVVYVALNIHSNISRQSSNTVSNTTNPNLYPALEASTTTLGLGDHITVGTTLLTPTEIIQDNRCGTGLQCVQAGTVTLAVNVSADDGASVINLSIGTPLTMEGLIITLIAVTPYPQAQEKINPADYRFTLNVQRNLQ